ncbi:MAG: glycosyltransferase family 39 protein [Chloroflexi bacterium]|nr:glycosyltransferase family 39 protein [Chloroflexota bacterium]
MKIIVWFAKRLLDTVDRLTTTPAIVVIVLLSISVKLSYILILGGGLGTFPNEGSDVWFISRATQNILQHGVYGMEADQPTAGAPPGQAVFLAILFTISNNSLVFAKLAHLALLTLVAVLVYLMGRELFSPSVGFGAGVLIAIDPAYAYLSGTFLSEPLYICLMTLAFYSLIRHRSNKNLVWLMIAGLCFGHAGLTRNEGWLFAIVLVFSAMITRGRVIAIRTSLVVLAVTVVVIAPWTYRNFRVTDKFVPVSLNGGLTLWSGNNPEFRYRQPMPMSLPIYATPPGLSGAEVDQYYRQKAIDWITDHPVRFAFNGLVKVAALYNFDPYSSRPEVSGIFRLAGLFPYGIMLPFIFLGLFEQLRNPDLWLILTYIIWTTLLAAVFFGDSRVRTPIQPYLYMLGSAWLVNRLRRVLDIEYNPTSTYQI